MHRDRTSSVITSPARAVQRCASARARTAAGIAAACAPGRGDRVPSVPGTAADRHRRPCGSARPWCRPGATSSTGLALGPSAGTSSATGRGRRRRSSRRRRRCRRDLEERFPRVPGVLDRVADGLADGQQQVVALVVGECAPRGGSHAERGGDGNRTLDRRKAPVPTTPSRPPIGGNGRRPAGRWVGMTVEGASPARDGVSVAVEGISRPRQAGSGVAHDRPRPGARCIAESSRSCSARRTTSSKPCSRRPCRRLPAGPRLDWHGEPATAPLAGAGLRREGVGPPGWLRGGHNRPRLSSAPRTGAPMRRGPAS